MKIVISSNCSQFQKRRVKNETVNGFEEPWPCSETQMSVEVSEKHLMTNSFISCKHLIGYGK